MVKKTKEPITEDPEVAPEPDEAFKAFVTNVGTGMKKLDENMNKLGQMVAANSNRIATVAKISSEAPKPKAGLDPMQLFQQILGLINSPLVTKLTDKMFGGAEGLPPAEVAISDTEREYLLGIKRSNDKMQARWMEAMVGTLETEAAKKAKEAGADW